MSAHTPGPWRAARHAILFDDPQLGITQLATVYSGAAESLDEAYANDRLIAAAPELLLALRTLCSIAIRPMRDADRDVFNAAVTIAESALSKVVGKS